MVECQVLRSRGVGRLPDEHCGIPEPPEEGGDEGVHQVGWRMHRAFFSDAEEDHYAKKVFPPPGRISEAHGPRCPTEEALSRSTRSTVQTPTP